MHIVSAAKLKKVKDKAACLNDFSHYLSNMIYHVSKDEEDLKLSPKYMRFFSDKLLSLPHLVIVMTSERGLCGGFNSSVIKQARKELEEYKSQGQDFRLIIVGKRGIEALTPEYGSYIDSTYNISGSYESIAEEIKNRVIELVETAEVGACFVHYNFFKNALTQILSKEQILPAKQYEEIDSDDVFDFEGEGLVAQLIDLYIKGEINYTLLQSKASEEGARMTAMDNSTKNATELIDKLTLKLNRSRQAIITTELTEIISGAEAL